LTENVQRKAMTPLELADAIQQMLEQGWQQIEISRQLGLNRVVEPIPCRFLMLIL
jgi:ParB-like chromosome segregation protein Spo0J